MCFNFFAYDKEIGKPKNLADITAGDLQNVLNVAYGGAKHRILDHKFKTTTFNEYMRFIENDKVNFTKYVGDYHDCDDYAFALFGAFCRNPDWSPLAFGYAEGNFLGKYHAYNLFVTNDGELYFVEPQDDSIELAMNNKYKVYYTAFG